MFDVTLVITTELAFQPFNPLRLDGFSPSFDGDCPVERQETVLAESAVREIFAVEKRMEIPQALAASLPSRAYSSWLSLASSDTA